MTREHEFYVGYQRQAPPTVARFVRRVVTLLVCGAAVVAAILAGAQAPFDPGVFEFGIFRHFEGVVRETPYPMLFVARPGETGDRAATGIYLVGAGKHGAERQVAGLEGRRARVRGSLVYREGELMLEIAAGGIERGAPARNRPDGGTVELGRRTLRGEIVDSKCFFGVMKPGRGKPHRACAARCISGGIPPVLRVEAASGEFRHFLLVDEEGGAVNTRVLDLVAEPVEITGRVRREGDLLILAADPSTYRRLSG
jgi:hypothetical protein